MGTTTRAYHNYIVRSASGARSLYAFHLPQHSPISLRFPNGLHLPRFILSLVQKNTTNLSFPSHPPASPPGLHHLLPRLPIWLRKPKARRLHHLHSRQELQALTSHGFARLSLSQKLPLLQIRGRCIGHSRRRDFYPAASFLV